MTAPELPTHDMTIVCDDIREEVSGKLTICGLYGNDIVLGTKLPATLPKLCFLTRLKGGTEHEVLHSLVAPDGEEMLKNMGPGRIKGMPGAIANLVVNVAPFNVRQEGEYIYKVIVDKETLHEMHFKISVRSVQ